MKSIKTKGVIRMKTFKINDKCIGCMACARVAENNFEIIDKKAIVMKQPENEEELQKSIHAMKTCPTDAIEEIKVELIVAESNVRETMERYLFLKSDLIELSNKFKTMQKPLMWNSVARFATFNDAAKMTGVSICEILHFINKKLGLENELMEVFPQCIKEIKSEISVEKDVYWKEDNLFVVENQDDLEVAIEKINSLKDGESLTVESSIEITPLTRFVAENGFEYSKEHFGLNKSKLFIHKKIDVKKLDIRNMKKDPFDIIINEAYNAKAGESFVLIQTFKPMPLINMLSSMGFEHEVEKEEPTEVRIKFTKIEEEEKAKDVGDKPSLVIQSATPVGYPIIMRLLQSERLKKAINIKELKIWEETEKHLGWIVNGKADISFSAVITASKFKNSPVKMPAVFIWDNFTLLSRDANVKSLGDLKGKEIHVPLFEDAPPAKITRYLIESKGLDYKEFKLKFGNPFGRPEQIMADFIMGKADNVLLREPEASFAIEAIKKQDKEYSEIDYGEIWNDANPGFGIFPNAGVIVKEELYVKYPEVMKIFEEELKASIDWVNENKKEAAKLSFDMMRNSIENVEAFINRATFEFVSGDALVNKVEEFYTILKENEILNIDIDDDLMKIFKN